MGEQRHQRTVNTPRWSVLGFKTMLGTNGVQSRQCWPFNEKFTLM